MKWQVAALSLALGAGVAFLPLARSARAAQPPGSDTDALMELLSEQQRRLDAQEARLQALEQGKGMSGLEFWGYGIGTYSTYNWESDRTKRADIDLERFTLGITKKFSPNVRMDVEIEWEHGGTGATMEFDKREEFGEFEQEVEKGGEVAIEEFSLEITHQALDMDWRWKVGHFTIPVGLINREHLPTQYFTVARTPSETTILPSTWHESGASLALTRGIVRMEAGVVNGLDSTAFTSGNWVAPGKQGRFETVNGENLATYLRADVKPWTGVNAGGAWYQGNTRDNRPKPDLDVPAVVTIYQWDVEVNRGPLLVRGSQVMGHLQNADRVTTANKNLSNNLGVKRSPVASEANAAFLGVGYDVLPFFKPSSHKLYVFAQADRYDSMAKVEGASVDNPFWDVDRQAFGINYLPLDGLIVKAESSVSKHASGEQDRTTAIGFGVVF